MKNTIQATVVYQNRRLFAQTASGQLWALTDEDIELFSLSLLEGFTIVIEDPDKMDQFCSVEYVLPREIVEEA